MLYWWQIRRKSEENQRVWSSVLHWQILSSSSMSWSVLLKVRSLLLSLRGAPAISCGYLSLSMGLPSASGSLSKPCKPFPEAKFLSACSARSKSSTYWGFEAVASSASPEASASATDFAVDAEALRSCFSISFAGSAKGEIPGLINWGIGSPARW